MKTISSRDSRSPKYAELGHYMLFCRKTATKCTKIFIIQLSYTVGIPIFWLADLYHVILTYLDLPSAPSSCQRLRCFLRFPAWAKPCPQCWHEKGLSPVCVRQCMARLLGHRKALPHKLQKNFFSRILSLGRCSLLWTNLTNTQTDNLSS